VKRALLTVAVLLAGACSRADIDNKEAVRAAMVEYLESNQSSTGLDLSRMDVSVDAVVFERDLARATVSFTIKGTDQGMQGNYTLERQGNKWGNVKNQNLTAAPHAMPDSGAAPAPEMPAGHPPVPAETPGQTK
jgi:hypothetical protein